MIQKKALIPERMNPSAGSGIVFVRIMRYLDRVV